MDTIYCLPHKTLASDPFCNLYPSRVDEYIWFFKTGPSWSNLIQGSRLESNSVSDIFLSDPSSYFYWIQLILFKYDLIVSMSLTEVYCSLTKVTRITKKLRIVLACSVSNGPLPSYGRANVSGNSTSFYISKNFWVNCTTVSVDNGFVEWLWVTLNVGLYVDLRCLSGGVW